MTTTLTLTSGQTSFTAAGYTILPAGTPVPDGAVGAIMQAAISAGVFISGAAGTGTTFIGSRRFVSSSTGAPVSGSWLVGDEVVDTAGAVWEYTAAGTWAAVGATGSGTYASKNVALRPTLSPVKPATYTLLTTFQTGHGYTGNGVGTITVNDTSVTAFGAQGVTVVSDTGTSGSLVSKAAQTSRDLSAVEFAVLCWVDDMTKLQTISVQFGDTTFANYFNVNALVGSAPGTTNSGLQARSGEWAWVHFTKADLGNTVGTPSWAAVTDIRFRIQGRGSGSVTVKLAALGTFPKHTAYPNGVVSICLDDCYASHLTLAAPALAKYGYPATLFPITELVGTAGRLAVSDMQQLARINRFEVGSHAATVANHNGYSGLDAATIDTDASTCKQWLSDNGFGAAEAFAWPSGSDTLAAENVIRKYFSAARHVIAAPRATLPPGVPFRIQSKFADNTTTLAAMTAEVDNAYANGSWAVLSFHDLTTGAPTGQQWGSANFASLIDYCATKGIPVQTFGQVLRALS